MFVYLSKITNKCSCKFWTIMPIQQATSCGACWENEIGTRVNICGSKSMSQCLLNKEKKKWKMREEFLFHPLCGGRGGYLWKVWACSMYRAFGERKTIGFFERLRGKLCLVPSKAALASLTSSFCNYSLDLILLRCFQLWAWFCVCLRIFIFFSMKDQKKKKMDYPLTKPCQVRTECKYKKKKKTQQSNNFKPKCSASIRKT